MHINKRYIFKNYTTGNETILELDIGAKAVSVLKYQGIEQEYPYVASLKEEHNQELLLAVLDLFTSDHSHIRTEYVVIGGAA